MVAAGAIHLFFEGYFSVNHQQMAPAQDLFGQLWKEYALSDSRYLTSDPFVLCMETVTAVCHLKPPSLPLVIQTMY
jgi:cholestenol delta-isomerase